MLNNNKHHNNLGSQLIFEGPRDAVESQTRHKKTTGIFTNFGKKPQTFVAEK